MSLAALVLAGSDVLLAAAVLTALARPRVLAGVLAWRQGMGEQWQLGELAWEREEALLTGATSLRAPLLALLFAWSFLTGAVIAASRL